MKRVIVTALIMLITTGCTFKYVPPEKRTEETTTATQTETIILQHPYRPMTGLC